MKRVVLDMMDRRPIWAMPSWVPERLREALPDGELVVVDVPTDGSGDGVGRVAPEVLAAVEDAHAYFGYGVPAELLEAGRALEWVHSGATGVGSSLTPAMRASPVIFTNSAGIHAEPIAETALGMILFFGRGLDFAVTNQRRSTWSTEPYYVAGAPLKELAETVVGILGYGGIGRALARRVSALGGRVVAVRRHEPDGVDADEAASDGRIEVVAGRAGLERVLDESDVLVLAAPDTPETRGVIDRSALARLRDGALVVNVARGRLVDEEALLEALREGRLRGAALDVFAREPLPAEHPFWALDNVLVTPHVTAVTRGFWRRQAGLIVRNLRRWLAGAPPSQWENVVDKRLGY